MLFGKASLELLLVILILDAVSFALVIALPLRLVLPVYDYTDETQPSRRPPHIPTPARTLVR